MTNTRVSVCDKCGVVYADSAGEDHGHDLIPCPLCHLKWEYDRKLSVEQTDKIDIRNRVNGWLNDINELKEQIKDLQEQIDELAEELE